MPQRTKAGIILRLRSGLKNIFKRV